MKQDDAIAWVENNPGSDPDTDASLISLLQAGLIVALWDLKGQQPRFFTPEHVDNEH